MLVEIPKTEVLKISNKKITKGPMSQEPDTRENVEVRFGWMGGAKFIDQWKREAEQIRGRGKGVGGAGRGHEGLQRHRIGRSRSI